MTVCRHTKHLHTTQRADEQDQDDQNYLGRWPDQFGAMSLQLVYVLSQSSLGLMQNEKPSEFCGILEREDSLFGLNQRKHSEKQLLHATHPHNQHTSSTHVHSVSTSTKHFLLHIFSLCSHFFLPVCAHIRVYECLTPLPTQTEGFVGKEKGGVGLCCFFARARVCMCSLSEDVR